MRGHSCVKSIQIIKYNEGEGGGERSARNKIKIKKKERYIRRVLRILYKSRIKFPKCFFFNEDLYTATRLATFITHITSYRSWLAREFLSYRIISHVLSLVIKNEWTYSPSPTRLVVPISFLHHPPSHDSSNIEFYPRRNNYRISFECA